MSDELKPCPFCGGLPISSYVRDGRVIACQGCHAHAPAAYNGPAGRPSAEDRARANWNTRSPLPTGKVGEEEKEDGSSSAESGARLASQVCDQQPERSAGDWQPWFGIDCPVADETRVDLRFDEPLYHDDPTRVFLDERAADWIWNIDDACPPIAAWRLHQSSEVLSGSQDGKGPVRALSALDEPSSPSLPRGDASALRTALELLERFLSADREALANHRPKWGIADAVDNSGKPYQSQYLADTLQAARELLALSPLGGEGKEEGVSRAAPREALEAIAQPPYGPGIDRLLEMAREVLLGEEGVSVDESATQGTTALRPDGPHSAGRCALGAEKCVCWTLASNCDHWISAGGGA